MVFLAGCASQDQGTKETTQTTLPTEEVGSINIGVVVSATGGSSVTGTDMWQAAVLASDEINENGGVIVNGKKYKVNLVKGDDESSVQAGVSAVTKLITEDKVDVLVGGFSSAITYANQVVAAEHKVPYIITGASSPVITQRKDIDTSYFFHHCPTTDDYGDQTLLFVDEVVKPAIYQKYNFSADRKLRLAVLLQDSKYGEGLLDGIKKAITNRNLNIEVVAQEKFKMGETDYRAALTTIKAANPDVVYPAAFVNEQTLIVVQGRRDVGLNSLYLSVECNDDPAYYKGSEKWSEYSIQESRFGPYAIPSGAVSGAVTKYKENFEKRWGKAPGMMGASTYEGIYLAVEAIKKAGTTDKEKIREALASIEMPQMIEAMNGGTIKFSKDYRESKFDLYMEQLYYDESLKETRPKIVWPNSLKQAEFVLPDWYQPGSG